MATLQEQFRRTVAEHNIAAESTQGKKLSVGGVIIDISDEEGLEYALNKHKHALQDGTMVTDHATREPIVFTVVGELVSEPRDTDEHKNKMSKLADFNRKAERIDIICDFPPRVLEGFLVTRFTPKRAKPWIDPNFYTVELTCEESPVAMAAGFDDEAIIDPTSGMRIEGSGSNLGERDPMVWGRGDQSGQPTDEIQSGPQPGDGGLFKWIKKGIEFVEDKTGLSVTDMAFNVAKGLANTILPGSGVALDIAKSIATGDFSLSDVADIVVSNIPGGGVVKDILSGPAGQALSFIEKIPGTKDLLSSVTNPESVAGSLLGEVANQIGKAVSGLGDSAGLINAVLNPAQAIGDIKDQVFAKAKEHGIPPALLKAGEKAVLGSG